MFKGGRLRLKGDVPVKKRVATEEELDRPKKRAIPEVEEEPTWSAVSERDHLVGPLFITCDTGFVCLAVDESGRVYLKTLEDPSPHPVEPTDVSQVFVLQPLSTVTASLDAIGQRKESATGSEPIYAFKTAFGKYLSSNPIGQVSATREAIGPQEQWHILFRESGLCIQHVLYQRFLKADATIPYVPGRLGSLEMPQVRADSETVGYTETFSIASQTALRRAHQEKLQLERAQSALARKKFVSPASGVMNAESLEDKSVVEVASHLARRYHSWTFGRRRPNDASAAEAPTREEDVRELQRAKQEGRLNEVLLERRIKVKADKFCK